jgi:hypothetical protein
VVVEKPGVKISGLVVIPDSGLPPTGTLTSSFGVAAPAAVEDRDELIPAITKAAVRLAAARRNHSNRVKVLKPIESPLALPSKQTMNDALSTATAPGERA